MRVSGFTFVHNALEGGYPIQEAIQVVEPIVEEMVVVDMQSTDGTRDILEAFGCRILNGVWNGKAGETLAQAHALYRECRGDIIIHFEADEVWDPFLLGHCLKYIRAGRSDLTVWRLQVEQNFQRIRWYPELVHRVFLRDSGTVKVGHTTNRHEEAISLRPEDGFLWDCTNCFRDNWKARIEAQAELWAEDPQFRRVPLHFSEAVQPQNLEEFLSQSHWTWKATPLAIPEILKPLVGMTRYEFKI